MCAGHSAAGTSAHSPVAAQVLAASQGMRRKSRLQHVTAADDAASPSGAPQQATPSSATASKAAGNLQRQGHTPQGTGHPCALEDGGQTPRTVGGSAYMTPPTGSAQRPAVRCTYCDICNYDYVEPMSMCVHAPAALVQPICATLTL